MRVAFRHTLRFGLGIGAIATFAGVFAPLVPKLELFNHIRPATAAGFLLVAMGALMLRDLRLGRAALLGLAFNGALTALPMIWAAPKDSHQATTPTLTLVTWNANWGTTELAPAAAELLRFDADVIALQELTQQQAVVLLRDLGARYPHRVLCQGATRCTGGLLSKWPLSQSSVAPGISGLHSLFLATLHHPVLPPVRVASLHLQYPFHAAEQAAHMKQVIADVRADLKRGLPLIIAGDFNLTPWSYLLSLFSIETGLKRHTSAAT